MFLEWLGVRWWSPDETFFPTCPSADKFIWACEEQWYANQAVGTTPGSKPIEVRDPGTWTASTHPLWALRMRINTGGYDRSSVAANKVLWANASLGRGGVITYTTLAPCGPSMHSPGACTGEGSTPADELWLVDLCAKGCAVAEAYASFAA